VYIRRRTSPVLWAAAASCACVDTRLWWFGRSLQLDERRAATRVTRTSNRPQPSLQTLPICEWSNLASGQLCAPFGCEVDDDFVAGAGRLPSFRRRRLIRTRSVRIQTASPPAASLFTVYTKRQSTPLLLGLGAASCVLVDTRVWWFGRSLQLDERRAATRVTRTSNRPHPQPSNASYM
jgi:hypothetical protein